LAALPLPTSGKKKKKKNKNSKKIQKKKNPICNCEFASNMSQRNEFDSIQEAIETLGGAAVGISAVVLFIVLVLFAQLYYARVDITRLSHDLESCRMSLEKASIDTQALLASVPGVKKKKKERKMTNEIRAQIEAKERDTSGRMMIGAPPNL
jgi:hypothetical protein